MKTTFNIKNGTYTCRKKWWLPKWVYAVVIDSLVRIEGDEIGVAS